ncbi:glycosyltransferase involved in cell wall biosynthesis [Rhodopseudomonas faecalis]|uniref:Glycosyltransferase involved in cell wall biosynthesis n=1 Tax=Rhodopseudomonas faecalis TaxID=99655 RepID=A0A318TH15_9BRAD|nr:glycosyltransferase family 4 protein [Rhodopseudomonas faecalis]PYF04172.1 glycosyltransferase involved in cell wall biosynthesis [Rhodopseudomonas faecalis]
MSAPSPSAVQSSRSNGLPLLSPQATAKIDARTRRPRVLLIQTQAENAGAQEISRLVAGGLTSRGYDVHNLYFFRQSASFAPPPNTHYCVAQRPSSILALARFLWKLRQQIKELQPDAILTFQHYGNAIGGVMARLACRAPVIANQVSARAAMAPWLQLVDRIMGQIGLFSCITVNSHDMLHDYARYGGLYQKRLRHVAHGFDQKVSELSRAEARRALGLPETGVVLGSAARLHPMKQLDAAIRVLPGRPQWRLALAGQGPDEPRLRQLAAELGVGDRVHFVGEIAPTQVGDFLAALDVFVFPSLAETFGLAAVEAANAGVPVVANDLPVLHEVLALNGEPAAVLVQAADTAALSAAIDRVLTDHDLRQRLQHNAAGLRARYSVDAMVDDYVKIIEETL